ncbi:Protein of unknown function [Gryllus bimaculatus]|nr:Protein of unknown function [Gryllus bimaculatus]
MKTVGRLGLKSDPFSDVSGTVVAVNVAGRSLEVATRSVKAWSREIAFRRIRTFTISNTSNWARKQSRGAGLFQRMDRFRP